MTRELEWLRRRLVRWEWQVIDQRIIGQLPGAVPARARIWRNRRRVWQVWLWLDGDTDRVCGEATSLETSWRLARKKFTLLVIARSKGQAMIDQWGTWPDPWPDTTGDKNGMA